MAPWQPPASAHLHSGPPSASSSSWTDPSLATRLRPNLSGLTAFQREQQFSKHYSDASRVPSPPKRSEWDVLRENHRFIRDDEEVGEVTWEERLARAYESKLFKEFALVSAVRRDVHVRTEASVALESRPGRQQACRSTGLWAAGSRRRRNGVTSRGGLPACICFPPASDFRLHGSPCSALFRASSALDPSRRDDFLALLM